MYLLSLERMGISSYQKDVHGAVRFINSNLYEKRKIFQTTEDVKLVTKMFPEGHIYPSGTYIFEDYNYEAHEYFTDVTSNSELLDQKNKFRPLGSIEGIGFYSGLNSAEFCEKPYKNLLDSMGFRYIELNDADIRNGKLQGIKLLIVPGGPDAGESYYAGLGEKGFLEIRNFIESGGSYLGSCAGSYLPLTSEEETTESRIWLNIVDADENDGLDYWRTGAGLVRISVKDKEPVAYGICYGRKTTMDVMYWEGPIFKANSSSIEVIAYYDEFVASGSEKPGWDVSSNSVAVDMMNWCNPLNKERFNYYMKDRPAAIKTTYGKGKLILFSFHPEFGYIYNPYEQDIIHLFISNSIYELMA
ncbi:BPL-N domain-containing protein [Clostridium magnum]|uniref:Biotin-protein ligase N-terminal domain-containing protein n=1 Tax=Clostridium magnum DSM 2767 TaxID=1121326 RepID=A0A161W1G4_9CLOT|nr:BPL-N domain-containing protein [Clostridium magnum]KZL89020.1 hypothetical protein CLMAG_57180 [Clostridium magnum DSM 2767]SHI23239.1 Biotin-protein ligase, N terminal [Clostridium magnum DSM 2767]